ncbi:MAG: TonB-dependent hemoglobin/transferrin/lactoferrin family receptor [Pseudomonadales bacterium]|nr:TonB-dependent hemoglobin/transferrin/lactoferrin family receptor [Pseudomonadales bacterium]
MRLRLSWPQFGPHLITVYLSMGSAFAAEPAGNEIESETGRENPVVDTITVTATRTARPSFEIPGMVSVVDATAAGTQGASRIKDLLRDVPGLEFSGSARRNGQNISMRGFDTDSLLILFDGVRQRFESAHDGKFFIDPSLLKTVEVVRGPGSALYGSGGLGGVVAFNTVSASDLLEPGQRWGALTTLNQSSVNEEWLVSQSGYLRSGNVDVLLNAVSRNSGDIELGDGNSLSAQDRIGSGMLKLDWRINPASELGLNVQGFRNDAEEPNNPQTADNDDQVDKLSTNYQSSLTYRYTGQSSELLDLTARLYYTDTDVDESEPLTGRDLSRQLDRKGLSLENRSRLALGSTVDSIFTYGAEFYTEEQDGADSATVNGEAGGVPDAETDFWGVFLQAEISFPAPIIPGEFLLIPGARLDSYESSNKTGLDLDEKEFSPRLGITYKPAPWLMMFGSYAEAFRAPTLTETFTTGTHFSIPGQGNNVFVPNADLKPEKSQTVEFGVGLQFQDLLARNDRLQIKASRFDTEGEDFIDTVVSFTPFPCCGTTTSDNIPDAELWGYDLEGSYENSLFRFSIGYAVVEGENRLTGDYLSTLSPDTLTTNLSFKLPGYSSVLGWRSRLASRHDKVNEASEERAGYGVHDLYYQWQPDWRDRRLSVNLNLDNLFDKDYERVFAGSPEPGRNVSLQVSYQWR